MEGRARRYGSQTSPERTKVWVEPPPKHQLQLQQGKRIPVVYYLCRNRHLEHPHFIEVPLSSPDGLYLRDVINRLNVLRGKGMAALYSWSCKRSYKNGFVWHDLSEDDLVLSAQGNEYILKGSELLDQCPPDWQSNGNSYPKIENLKHPQEESPNSCRTQEGYSSSSSPSMVVKEAKHAPPSPPPTLPPQPPSPPPAAPRDEESCRTPRSDLSGNFSPEPAGRNAPSSGASSPSLTEYRVYKPIGAQDASTQTEDRKARMGHATDTQSKGVSTDDGSPETGFQGRHYNGTPTSRDESEIVRVSPAPTSSSASSGGRVDTLESLIRAEASKINSFRILEEDIFVPMGAKLKASNVLMQLITCGSVSVKDHHSFGLIPTYRPRFTQSGFPSPMFSTSMILGDLDRFSEIPRSTRLRMEEAEYFSGSLIETKKHKEETGKGVPMLKRSSSFEEERTSKTSDMKRERDNLVDSASSKCLPRTIKMASCKQTRNDTISSPISDTRNSSGRPECNRPSPLGSSNHGSKRLTDSSSLQGSSMRLESFREEKEKVIKIEERLASGARVIIQSTPLHDESNDSS